MQGRALLAAIVGYPVHLAAEALPEALEECLVGEADTADDLLARLPYLTAAQYKLLVEQSGRTDAPLDDRSEAGGGTAGDFFRKPRVAEKVWEDWKRWQEERAGPAPVDDVPSEQPSYGPDVDEEFEHRGVHVIY